MSEHKSLYKELDSQLAFPFQSHIPYQQFFGKGIPFGFEMTLCYFAEKNYLLSGNLCID